MKIEESNSTEEDQAPSMEANPDVNDINMDEMEARSIDLDSEGSTEGLFGNVREKFPGIYQDVQEDDELNEEY